MPDSIHLLSLPFLFLIFFCLDEIPWPYPQAWLWRLWPALPLCILILLWQPRQMLGSVVSTHQPLHGVLISSAEHFWKWSCLFQVPRWRSLPRHQTDKCCPVNWKIIHFILILGDAEGVVNWNLFQCYMIRHRQVQAFGKCVCWQGGSVQQMSVKSCRAVLRDWGAVSQRCVDQKFLIVEQLDCSVHFIYYFIHA